MVDTTLGGIAAIATLFVIGTVFGRLHGSDGRAIKAIGDRVTSGLLAIPLIVVCVRLAFPHSHVGWALAAPVPLAIYTLLLAGTDLEWTLAKQHFILSLLIGIGVVYLIMAAVAWSTAT